MGAVLSRAPSCRPVPYPMPLRAGRSPGPQQPVSCWPQQRGMVTLDLAEPGRPVLLFEDRRHAVV